jgi:hypothetical protein
MLKNRQMWLVVAAVIAVLLIYRDPTGSASAVRSVLDVFFGALGSVVDFTAAVMR